MADMRARGIIKNRTKEEQDEDEKKAIERARIEAEEGFPWLIVGGLILGVLAVFGILAAIIIFIIMKYVDTD